jgi:hypothetical protein
LGTGKPKFLKEARKPWDRIHDQIILSLLGIENSGPAFHKFGFTLPDDTGAFCLNSFLSLVRRETPAFLDEPVLL